MCTCKTDCNCKPARTPKAGEIWIRRGNEASTVDILAVTDDGVLYRFKTNSGIFNDGIYGRSIVDFLSYYGPPKPKPRVIYVSKTNCQIFDGDRVRSGYDEEYACAKGKEKFVKFVEALE